MIASVIVNKDTRDGRRGRLSHKRYVTPPPYDDHVSRLLQKKKKDCRKEERLRSLDTKVSCTADVSSLPSVNNVIVIGKPRKFHSSIQNLAARFKKKKLTVGHNARAHRLNTIAEGKNDVIFAWW